jgi:hypothetical protein
MLRNRTQSSVFVATCLVAFQWLVASPATAERVWFKCHVAEVWDGSSELPHYSAHCIEPWQRNTTSVTAFIVPIADRGRAARFFNLATAALLSGRVMTFLFDSDESNPVCGTVDCRTALAFGLER